MKDRINCWFHRWTKWEDYYQGREFINTLTHQNANNEKSGYPCLIQERRCIRCHIAERRKISTIR